MTPEEACLPVSLQYPPRLVGEVALFGQGVVVAVEGADVVDRPGHWAGLDG